MKLLGRLEMKSPHRVAEFLEREHVGRIASTDKNGYPQVIPMNFVFLGGAIYMHSFPRGEKIDNITRNDKVGFEVDRELEFLPSYFTHPTDASVADTLYISVVIKGRACVVEDYTEKCLALNGLMQKYQPEGGYEPVCPTDLVLDQAAVIKVVPEEMRGKYKIGQHVGAGEREKLAQKILERGSPTARATLGVMGFRVEDGRAVEQERQIW